MSALRCNRNDSSRYGFDDSTVRRQTHSKVCQCHETKIAPDLTRSKEWRKRVLTLSGLGRLARP